MRELGKNELVDVGGGALEDFQLVVFAGTYLANTGGSMMDTEGFTIQDYGSSSGSTTSNAVRTLQTSCDITGGSISTTSGSMTVTTGTSNTIAYTTGTTNTTINYGNCSSGSSSSSGASNTSLSYGPW